MPQRNPSKESPSSPTKGGPAKVSPKNNTTIHSGTLKADPEPNVGPLVDLSDTPKVAPSSNPTPPVLGANSDEPQLQCDSGKVPNSSQSKDLQVDSSTKDTTLSSDSTTSAQNEYEQLCFVFLEFSRLF